MNPNIMKLNEVKFNAKVTLIIFPQFIKVFFV